MSCEGSRIIGATAEIVPPWQQPKPEPAMPSKRFIFGPERNDFFERAGSISYRRRRTQEEEKDPR
jgi:hypothetical protein